MDFDNLVKGQLALGKEIQQVVSNFKKDSGERKSNKSYFEERLKRLTTPYEQFIKNDDSMRELARPPLNHEYFSKDYYAEITKLVEEYSSMFHQEIGRFNDQAHEKASSSNQELQGLFRKQRALKESARRFLTNIPSTASPSYYAVKVKSLEQIWQQIENYHLQIYGSCDNPQLAGYDDNDYISIEMEVQEQLTKLILQTEQTEFSHTNTSITPASFSPQILPLPKVSIPTFNGDYLKWTQFHDMFTQIVDTQNIPKVQKMWHLKSSLSGEAERIIRHLPLSESNYATAWTLIKSRFDNKRLLVSSHVQKLLDQQGSIFTGAAIKNLHDTTQESLLALNNLAIETDSWGPLLVAILLPKLDKQTRILYEQSLTNPRGVLTTKEFLEFLETRFQALEAVGVKENQRAPHKALTSTSVQNASQTCKHCNTGSHHLYNCEFFLRASVQDRIKIVQKTKACLNCLRLGHQANQCSSRSCTKCNRRHNTLLHVNPTQSHEGSKMQKPATAEKPPQTSGSLTATQQTSLHSFSAPCSGYVMLGTVQLKIIDADGKAVECRALLDSGSQINFITERLAKQLKLAPEPMPIIIEGIGTNKKKSSFSVTTSIKSRFNTFNAVIKAFVLPKIVSNQPTRHIDISEWHMPENLNLADERFNHPSSIDLLLGAELHHKILASGQIQLGNNLPILQNTVFGWISAGKIHNCFQDSASCAVGCNSEEELSNILTKFWELDSLNMPRSQLTEEEKKCEALFAQHTQRNKEGRFVVKIPFKESTETLGESMRVALSRFYGLERRLSKQPELKLMYTEFMREYERLNHMNKIDPNTILSPNYFIPHHCIVKPDSSTTKLRVVFDASAQTSTGVSLNDIMYNGPVVQSDLQSILTRFRAHRFVFTTDIEKMYRQMVTHPDHQRFQIIVWREDPSQQMQFYKLKTVTYGTRAAPYLATKCLQMLSKEFKEMYPLGAVALERDFYVDDGLTGSDSLREAIEIKHQLVKILSTAGFKLRKWCANHSKLLEDISSQDQEVDLDFADKSVQKKIKTLGLIWLPTSDEFSIKTSRSDNKTMTKRTVTSDLARIYDPLGLVAPVVVKAKIFVQQLWQLKLNWDDPLPVEFENKWSLFCKHLEVLENLKIPRHLTNHKRSKELQIHVFTDASERAYGAAAYLRAKCDDGTISVQLISSKSRVAPLQMQTIPRLELCAALLGAQLITKVKTDLPFRDIPMWLWTDSEIVLHWINSEAGKYQTFVAHRIGKIQELTLKQQWRHVSTSSNPADYLTRGIQPTDIKGCSLWFHGPIFLHGSEECWPPKFRKELSVPDRKELKRTAPALASSRNPDLVDMVYTINHHNSFKTLVRIIAYVLRLIKRLQRKEICTNKIPSCEELDEALIIIVKAVQLSEFEDEIKMFKKCNEIKSTSTLFGLTPFIDKNGIIRVGGRIAASNLSFDAKHPILLPYNDSITKLIMQQRHEEGLHCSAQALLAQTRQKFWPIKGKIMARSIVEHCVRCRRAKPKTYEQLMGNLPKDRVQPNRPFYNSGVDFLGPVWIHYKIRGKKPCKAYIAVFCCFVTKAVHMEVVSDLTTEAFIGALQRFLSRRGLCKNLYCDNATNFVGAKNQLHELNETIFKNSAQNRISQFCSDKRIIFHFIPPRAPHFGGLWEAAVKSAKYLLVRSVGNASLTYEELETVVIQAEAILNSRPLTPLSADPNNLIALTPGHFLIGEPLTSHSTGNTTISKTPLPTRWKLVNQLKEEFWSRWSKEYLNELQYRHKWKIPSANVEIGTLVIIKEDFRPPLNWPLGRILKTYKGEDGLVRVADVKTATGVLKRPIHKLAPLFGEDTQQEPSITQQRPIHKLAPFFGEDTQQEPSMTQQNSSKKEQANVHDNNQPKKKRRRINMCNYSSLFMIAILILLPAAFANQIKISNFGSKPGIHFENLGSAKIVSTHWNLIVYYDLQPYKTELEALSNGTLLLRRICDVLKQSSGFHHVVSQLQQVKEELELENSLFLNKRVKRGAINVVGNVANALFGVLDSDYAEQMQKTITSIDNNDKYLLELLKNQTSVLDSTINILKLDQSQTRQKFDQFDKKLIFIENQVLSRSDAEGRNKNFQLLSSLSLQLLIIVSNLQRIQAAIVNVLTDVHHGQISPLLLSPSQLRDEIIKIKTQLAPHLQLPIPQEDLLDIYKLMDVESGITFDYVIFQIKLPLIDSDKFNIFKLHPIPALISNNTLVAVKISTKNLAITDHGDKFFPMNAEQINSCIILRKRNYLCPNPEAIYNKESIKYHCEVGIFNNETKSVCALERIENDLWTQLDNKFQWLFALKKPTKLTAVCGKERSQLSLEHAGLLTLPPDCVVKHNSFTIFRFDKVSSKLDASYTSVGVLSKVADIKSIERIQNEEELKQYKDYQYELTKLQETLQKHKKLELPNQIESSQYHQITVSYLALFFICCILFNQGLKFWRSRKALKNKEKPSPMTREEIADTKTTEFTINI